MGLLGKINPFNIRHGFIHTLASNPVLGKVIPIAASLIGGPELGAAVTGLYSYANGAKPITALENAGLSYAGNSIGSSIGSKLFPSDIGTAIGPSASNALGAADAGINSAIGNGFSQTASNAILKTGIGSTLGGIAGSNIASNSIFPQTQGQDQQTANPTSLLPAAFTPKNNPQLQLPGSLSGLSNLTPDQQTSNLATKGVYGGGLGPQEQQYFTGLINNQLVDPTGKVGDKNSLSPIDNSYLSQLGFGGYSNSKDLLGAISNWQKNQQQATT